jgi:RNA polymerase sigma-70 factor (ECF subfamily)
MHERVDSIRGGIMTADLQLEREFDALLVESSRLAFRVAFSVLRQREDAEDTAQEAFAKAHRAFHQLRDRGRFRAWLVRMTFRLALDRQRANRRRTARVLSTDHLELAPAPATPSHEDTERATHVWNAIDALSEKLRIVVVLASIEGHSVQEVASLLGLPAGTVKSRLFLARQELKERLAWMADTGHP